MIYQSFTILNCNGAFAQYWQARYRMLYFISKLNGI
jgi:hypothetical protein